MLPKVCSLEWTLSIPVVRTGRVRKLPATASRKLLSAHVNSTRPPGSIVRSLAYSNHRHSTSTYVFSPVRCECTSQRRAQVSPPAIRGFAHRQLAIPAHSEYDGHVCGGAAAVHLAKRAFAATMPSSMPTCRDYVIESRHRLAFAPRHVCRVCPFSAMWLMVLTAVLGTICHGRSAKLLVPSRASAS